MAKQPTCNQITASLWETMQSNKSGTVDNDRAKAQAMVAGKILKGYADKIKYKKMTNNPEKIPFYEE